MTDLIHCTPDDGKSRIQLRADEQTVWLTQLEMAELFYATKQNICLHLKNILKDGELDEGSVVKESLATGADSKAYLTKLYNLDAIPAVGSRVRSPRGVQFRRWAFFAPTGRRIPAKGGTLDRATPRVWNGPHPRVLKERRLSAEGGRASDQHQCAVLSERMNRFSPVPGVAPRAGIRRPFGAVTLNIPC